MLSVNLSFVAKTIEKKDIKGKKTAIVKGYQSREDQDGNKIYDSVTVFFAYSDNTVGKVKEIATEIGSNKYAIVELFSGNFNTQRNEYEGNVRYDNVVNTNYVRLKEMAR